MDRFWSKVDRSGDCWLWTAAVDGKGYGSFWLDGKARLAHAVAKLLVHGPGLPGQVLLHLCDTRLCCHPDHLQYGSVAENQQDMADKGRGRTATSRLTIEGYAAAMRATGTKPAAEFLGMSQVAVVSIRHGRTWRRYRDALA